jgi:hypothetical protein
VPLPKLHFSQRQFLFFFEGSVVLGRRLVFPVLYDPKVKVKT